MSQPSAFETRHHYTLHGKIASGGMGTIRLGLQQVTRGFSRVVAIKQIHAMYANNQEFVAMFRDEFRVASRVVHPNVVPILDVMSADDQLSLVMEYVHGLSVARLLTSAGAAPSPEIATTIMIGMLHGLHAAHEALSETGEHLNVVHRDVTPQNVMVGVDGAPRLLDFGIAHALGRARTTTVGQIKGKVKYLAPEQLKGEPIDRRADIYSASVVFWEMLTGRRLFGSGKDDDMIDLSSRRSVEDPHLVRPGISPRLSRIVLRGLQPDPEARHATALDMAVALEEGAATVSATKVGEWVRRVWGSAGLARLQEIRAIEGGVAAAVDGDAPRRRGQARERRPRDGSVAAASDLSDAQMTVPGRRLGGPTREAGETTMLCETDDSLFGEPRALPPFVRRQGREPDVWLEDAPAAQSPWPVNGVVSPARAKGRPVTLAAVLAVLGSALAWFIMRGPFLPRTSDSIPASEAPAAAAQTTARAGATSVPVIEITSPPVAPVGDAPPSPRPPSTVTSAAVPPAPPVAAPAASPEHPPQIPRRTGGSIGRTKPHGGSRLARARSVPRGSPGTAPAGAAAETVENARPPAAAPPSCDPPYVIDEDGIKRFKLSCL